jgi:asparagine synthase (glutamine-hydrolysing)
MKEAGFILLPEMKSLADQNIFTFPPDIIIQKKQVLLQYVVYEDYEKADQNLDLELI